MMHEIYYVTGNKGKYEMAKRYLETHHADCSLQRVDLHLIEEQSLDLRAIAISKAEQAWAVLQKPLLVDDSGIYFHRYNHFPGTMTKFIYKALGFDGLYRLYDAGDSANFVTFLVYIDEQRHHVFEGNVAGSLIKPNLTDKDIDLPYVHLLIPNGSTQTLYESMAGTGYSPFSPRIIALQKFVEYWKSK